MANHIGRVALVGVSVYQAFVKSKIMLTLSPRLVATLANILPRSLSR